MLYWVIQITVISIILIFLVHHLINFFKATLTVPKIKDLVNTPTQKYENIYNILKKNSKTSIEPDPEYSENQDYTLIDLLPKKETPTMKNELKNFLKKQLHRSSDDIPAINGTNINSLDSISSFANF
jgi:uncharacterized membrane-anchored protein YitT (DUF2179 family)